MQILAAVCVQCFSKTLRDKSLETYKVVYRSACVVRFQVTTFGIHCVDIMKDISLYFENRVIALDPLFMLSLCLPWKGRGGVLSV